MASLGHDPAADAQVVLKLLASHITCVYAYCHLLSLRRGKLNSWEPYLYFLCPLIPVARLAVGLPIALIAMLFTVFLLRLRILVGTDWLLSIP